MARLLPELRPTDITALVQSALHAIENLATQHNLRLEVTMPRMPVIVSTNSVMARQVLVNLLSHTVQLAQAGDMHIELRADEDDVSLHLDYTRQQNAILDTESDSATAQLANRLGWKLTHHEGGDILLLVNSGPAILIIDDNEGLVQLLDRYLTGHSCRVIAAGSGQQGLELAHQSPPDAIVLDVMMPEMDGWELLQRLRNHPQTSAIPVIICTVFNDPELAYSLGASLFLPKPVSREDVMQALQKLGIN
jgi:CheY-like chemotaxis protein